MTPTWERKNRRRPGALPSAAAALLALAAPAPAATYTWTKTATGAYNWNTSANWSPAGFPDAPGDVANITANAGGYVTNLLNQSSVTVGILNIGDTDTQTRRPFAICTNAPGQVLVFDNGAADAQLGQNATSAGDTIAAPVHIAGSLRLSSATTDRALTIEGPVSGGPGGDAAALTKLGPGTVSLTAANTFAGLVAVRAGNLAGAARRDGSPFGNDANDIVLGDRDPLLATHLPTLTLTGLADATTTAIGDLTAAGSFNSGTIALNAAAGGGTTLQCANLIRDGGATLVVAPRSATSLAADEFVTFSGSGTSLVNGILPPWLAVALNGGDFATYGADGVARAAYTDTTFNPTRTDQVVNLTSPAVLFAAQVAYAARLAANLDLNGNTLTLGDGTTGGLIMANGTSLSNSGGFGRLVVAGELALYVDGAASATIGAPLSGTGTIRKFGTGTLIIAHPGLHDGDIALQAGKLTLAPVASFSFPGRIAGAGTLGKDGTNSVLLDGASVTAGSVWLTSGTLALKTATVTNLAGLTMGPTAQGTFPPATLAIADGSRWTQMSGGAVIGQTSHGGYLKANGHAVTVSGHHPVDGAAAVWNLGGGNLIVGYRRDSTCSADNNSLTVGAGGLVTNAALVSLGYEQGGNYNTLSVTNGGRLFTTRATVGSMGVGCTATVSADSLWDNGGGGITVGSSGGSVEPVGSRLVIRGDGAVVTNVGGVTVANRSTNGGSIHDCGIEIADGGRLFSRGETVLGYANGGNGTTYDNFAAVNGSGSRWDGGGATFRVNYGSQGYARGNRLAIADGAAVSGVGALHVGYANARHANEGRIAVTNGATLDTTGGVTIGRANGGSQSNPAHLNRVDVDGGALGVSTWDLHGANLVIGNASAGTAASCAATGNVVRAGRGGVITNIGALTVGSGVNGQANRLVPAGGSVRAASLTLSAGNILAPVIDANGIASMTVSGTATFAAGSLLAPDALPGAGPGTCTVLVAGTLVDNGLALDPAVDASRWSFKIDGNVLILRYKTRGTCLFLR
jgi:fibronectin-binding autotransporter adhesin